jgi:hypothetical protein
MKTTKKIILIVGLVWGAICALFPPRQYVSGVYDSSIIPTHEFLFAPRFQMFFYQPGLANYSNVEVSGGRLLAELMLIAAITGIAFLLHDDITKGLNDHMA